MMTWASREDSLKLTRVRALIYRYRIEAVEEGDEMKWQVADDIGEALDEVVEGP